MLTRAIQKAILSLLVTLQIFIASYFLAYGLSQKAQAKSSEITLNSQQKQLVSSPVSVNIHINSPEPTITPTPSPKRNQLSEEYIKTRICEVFGSQCRNALIIAQHESGFNPIATSYTQDYGVMQVNCYWHKEKVGGDCTKLFDLETNLRIAKQIYDDSGWQAWSTYRYL